MKGPRKELQSEESGKISGEREVVVETVSNKKSIVPLHRQEDLLQSKTTGN